MFLFRCMVRLLLKPMKQVALLCQRTAVIQRVADGLINWTQCERDYLPDAFA